MSSSRNAKRKRKAATKARSNAKDRKVVRRLKVERDARIQKRKEDEEKGSHRTHDISGPGGSFVSQMGGGC